MDRPAAVVVMAGAFPPPMHGVGAVNQAVYEALRRSGCRPLVINTAASTLERSLRERLLRAPRVIKGLLTLLLSRRKRGGALYISVAGGVAQLYDCAFALMARFFGMRLFLHHHSYAYLARHNLLTQALTMVAGSRAVHITQCRLMSARLQSRYPGVRRVHSVSNAAFVVNPEDSPTSHRQRMTTIGFISNIAAEKGIFEFLDLMAGAENAHLSLRGMIAGPFQDEQTEIRVRGRLARLDSVEYLGPKYGVEKSAFFGKIDVLAFPTTYANETEGMVTLEALNHGIPVIAYGRACIPESLRDKGSLVIDSRDDFASAALRQLKLWRDDPPAYQRACQSASGGFQALLAESEAHWQEVLGLLRSG